MIIMNKGHLYVVKNVDGKGEQQIRFVRRRDKRGEKLDEAEEGIPSQELLRVLIDRTLYLYAEEPCDEDTKIITKLRECLELYESRAARKTIERIVKIEEEPVCSICGHILCIHQK
jgi:hypothetical protein